MMWFPVLKELGIVLALTYIAMQISAITMQWVGWTFFIGAFLLIHYWRIV